MYYTGLDGQTEPGGKQTKIVKGVDVTTWQREVTSCNILEIEVGTTGFKGGDTGHGGRTYLRIEDLGGTDIDVRAISDDECGNGGVEIMLGGDTELETFIEALKWAVSVLEIKSE